MSGDKATASRLDAADLQALLDGGAHIDERELRAVIETSSQLIAVTGGDGHFLLLNKQWERALGWSREELRARPFVEFVHPDDVEKTRVTAERMFAQSAVLSFSNRYQCKDGSYCFLRWRGFFDRSTSRFYTASDDLSDVLAARAESEAMDALCELVEGVVAVEDAQGRLTRWDEGRGAGFGWRSAELVGRPSAELLFAEAGGAAGLAALLDDSVDEDAIHARLMLPSGDTTPVRVAAREFGDGQTPIVGIVATIRPARENR
jgi:PAS domain S-box-containing protein